ncbi:MAG: SDR family oxidoreductase [Fibrobacterota bacterium]
MVKKKVLVTGLWGLLGQNLLQALKGGYEVTGLDIAPAPPALAGSVPCHAVDITDKNALALFFKEYRPDILINTAAMTNVDGCEKEKEQADAVNHGAVRNLLAACGPIERFVQISTDYVFDGKNGPYADNAAPNPISEYGRSKLAAEQAVQASGKSFLIVRTMVLWGSGHGLKPDFPSWVKNSLAEGQTIRVVTDQVGNITLAANLSQNIRACLQAGTMGTLALTGADILDRHTIACCVADHYGLDRRRILPIRTADLHQPAPRPLNSGFTLNRARTLPGVRFLTFDEQLKETDHG